LENTSILTYESFLELTSTVRNLSILQKKICILENNLLTRFENPSNAEIPDFDSEKFQEQEQKGEVYSKYYSYCIHENGKQYIQYIKHYVDNEDDIRKEVLIPPVALVVSTSLTSYQPLKAQVERTLETLSSQDGSVNKLLEDIYNENPITEKDFIVDKQDAGNPLFSILQGASNRLKLGLTFAYNESNLKVEVRKELFDTLNNVWGYKSFRDLKMYKDLNQGKDIVNIGQGEIIETVVRQAEKALNDQGKGMYNILLTSPTGAGKSLLFQLAAIYLANKYQALTIIVSPLVALMNDQVDNLVGNYKNVATLNGNIPPTQKDNIIEKIKNGEIHILYLAPELLLSYSINNFISDRKIGLFVIDEAHTVTTWGRDFRVDYWFLGDYLRQSKRVLGYNFPIFALTATAVWDISGRNDMVFDTIRSLYMDPCIKFIGVARRDDIHFDICDPKITTNYNVLRNRLTIQRIHEFVAKKEKAIVYFPYKSTIRKVMEDDSMVDCIDSVTEYHASLNPNEKTENANDFKTGRKCVMCATKAYGMGVDVSDIKIVYHHAPTGCLSDYVQEIGRVARDEKITGTAKIDFSEYDFRYARTLHGLSAIKSYQLKALLKKLMDLFKMKGEKRNMLISSSDFEYIFPGKDVDYDQKVKSCLLLISHDLLNKLGFNAIIVRPKSLFSKSYIMISPAQEQLFCQKFGKYIHPACITNHIYKLDSDRLWNEHFYNFTFPNFKRKLAEGDITKGFNITIVNRIDLILSSDISTVKQALTTFFGYAKKALDIMSLEHRRITFDELKGMLPTSYNNSKKEVFIETFKMVYATDTPQNGEFKRYCSVQNISSFQLTNHGYEQAQNVYMKTFNDFITEREQRFYESPYSPLIKVCELLNSLELASYQRLGGELPSIFVRINNPAYLYDLVRKGTYSNDILNDIYKKFEYSEKVFTYFFTTEMTDKERWDFIESYFLGASEEDLLK
jgi:superfamily II DNA helicase RecQ